MYTGNCLCGGITFQINAELKPIQVCHCRQCRQAQGVPFAANIPVDTSGFELLSGEGLLKEYESSEGKQRVFCSNCGSPIFSKKASLPGVIRIRAGSLNEDLPVRPASHGYFASKCNWWDINDDVPKHPEAVAVKG